MPHNKTGAIYAYNDPNWVDSALKRCTQFNSGYNWQCAFCCNYSICRTLMQEEREKQLKEREEELKNMQELKIEICEPAVNANASRLYYDAGQGIYTSYRYDRADAYLDRARAYEVVEPQLDSLSEYLSEILATRTMRMTCDTDGSFNIEYVDSSEA